MDFLSRPTQTESSPSWAQHTLALFAGVLIWISVNGSHFFPIGILYALPMAFTSAGRTQLARFLNPSTGWRSWLGFAVVCAAVFYSHQVGKGFGFGFELPWGGGHIAGWFVL